MTRQYEILFGEKKKKDPNAEPVANFNMAHPSPQPNSGQSYPGMAGNANERLLHGAMSANATLGLTNEPDQYMLNSGRNERPAQKKRVHRSFQQLLKKDQMSYIPPSLPLYQHGVCAVSSAECRWSAACSLVCACHFVQMGMLSGVPAHHMLSALPSPPNLSGILPSPTSECLALDVLLVSVDLPGHVYSALCSEYASSPRLQSSECAGHVWAPYDGRRWTKRPPRQKWRDWTQLGSGRFQSRIRCAATTPADEAIVLHPKAKFVVDEIF